MRKVSDSADISMLKIAADFFEPSAAFSAMLTASVVLPMDGRPATMIRSPGCRPRGHLVELLEPGRNAGQLAVGLVELVDPVDHVRQDAT